MGETRTGRRLRRLLRECELRPGPALLLAAACAFVVVAGLLGAW